MLLNITVLYQNELAPLFVFKNMVACSQGSPRTWYVALSSWSFCLHFSQIGSTDTMLGSTWVFHLPFPEFQTWILIYVAQPPWVIKAMSDVFFNFIFIIVYVSVCAHMCVPIGTCRGRRYQNSPELELQVVCELPDVGTGYRSWVLCRVHVVTTEPSL